MSCCPGIKCKNTGSGYTKPSGGSGAASEIDTRMKDLLAARAADDARIWNKPVEDQGLGKNPASQTIHPINSTKTNRR